jgi:regulator of protease activity HflC (stomatin/prohibitin superfamily)
MQVKNLRRRVPLRPPRELEMWIKRKTVYEHEVGLRFSDGKLHGQVGPGRYLLIGSGNEIQTFDTRPATSVLGGQEVMSQDGGTLKVSLMLTQRLVDARMFYLSGGSSIGSDRMGLMPGWNFMPRGIVDPEMESRLRTKAQVLIREWITPRTLAQVLEERVTLVEAIREPLQDVARETGLEIIELDLLELSISGNIRAAHADLLKANLEAQASLQRARNEAATMRSLLNTARLVRDHPGLLELRALTNGQKPRVSVVINHTPLNEPAATPEPDEEA